MIENEETRNEQNKPTPPPSNGSALGGLIALGIALFILYTVLTM